MWSAIVKYSVSTMKQTKYGNILIENLMLSKSGPRRYHHTKSFEIFQLKFIEEKPTNKYLQFIKWLEAFLDDTVLSGSWLFTMLFLCRWKAKINNVFIKP